MSRTELISPFLQDVTASEQCWHQLRSSSLKSAVFKISHFCIHHIQSNDQVLPILSPTPQGQTASFWVRSLEQPHGGSLYDNPQGLPPAAIHTVVWPSRPPPLIEHSEHDGIWLLRGWQDYSSFLISNRVGHISLLKLVFWISNSTLFQAYYWLNLYI